MTLATTCPQCRTSFKVVPDQLKLRRGLVRCGACQHVFSGIDSLTYLEAGERSDLRAPAPQQASDTAVLHNVSPQADQPPVARPPSDRTHDLSTTILAAAQLRFRQSQSASDLGPDTVDAASERSPEELLTEHQETDPEPRADAVDSTPWPDAGQIAEPIDQDAERSRTHTLALGPQAPEPAQSSVIEPADEGHLPDLEHVTLESAGLASNDATHAADVTHSSFEQAAPERPSESLSQEHEVVGETDLAAPLTRAPERRIPWMAALVFAALAALLVAQAGIGWRNEIVARLPAVQPVMGLLGLAIEPPRDRASLSIESFELRTTDAAGRLELSAVLRNRATYAVALPAMELSLTDGGGAVVIRKVLKAAEYAETAGLSASALPARSERPIRLMLELAGPPPSGYSVDIFYP